MPAEIVNISVLTFIFVACRCHNKLAHLNPVGSQSQKFKTTNLDNLGGFQGSLWDQKMLTFQFISQWKVDQTIPSHHLSMSRKMLLQISMFKTAAESHRAFSKHLTKCCCFSILKFQGPQMRCIHLQMSTNTIGCPFCVSTRVVKFCMFLYINSMNFWPWLNIIKGMNSVVLTKSTYNTRY